MGFKIFGQFVFGVLMLAVFALAGLGSFALYEGAIIIEPEKPYIEYATVEDANAWQNEVDKIQKQRDLFEEQLRASEEKLRTAEEKIKNLNEEIQKATMLVAETKIEKSNSGEKEFTLEIPKLEVPKDRKATATEMPKPNPAPTVLPPEKSFWDKMMFWKD